MAMPYFSRVVPADGGAGHHDFGASHVLGAMAFKDNGPKLGQTLGDRRELQVRPGDFVAERQQDLGDAAHADAADAYEMNTLYFCEHGLCDYRAFRDCNSNVGP